MAVEEQERERRRQVVEKFQKAPFEEIAAHCGARVSVVFLRVSTLWKEVGSIPIVFNMSVAI